MWLLILFSIAVTVSMMTYFGWFYYDSKVNNPSKSKNMRNASRINNVRRLRNEVIFNNFGANAIYVINILTNQGKLIKSLVKLCVIVRALYYNFDFGN